MILPPQVIARLSGDGVTSKYLKERYGFTMSQIKDMMEEMGATQHSAYWKLPNLQRRILGAEKWAKPAQYTEPSQGRAIARTTNRAGAIE